MAKKMSTFGSGTSIVVTKCQICENSDLTSIIFIGYLPPVNTLEPIGTRPHEQASYPAELLYCKKCHLIQLGLIVDPKILFPYEYPYTSSTTKVLRDNFSELSDEVSELIGLKKEDVVIDIGSNDGNLLNYFKNKSTVLGVTPEEIGRLAIKNGIPTIIDYFTNEVTVDILNKYGKAKVITATNVFAHMENIHDVLKNIKRLMKNDGVFISESHYVLPLIETVQYDTIYHEHLRYYSLHSLKYLLEMHGLEVFHAKDIPSHGGSIRVYAAKKGSYKIKKTVSEMLAKEKKTVIGIKSLQNFRENVVTSKLSLLSLLKTIKSKGEKIYGISAPSRATTLINYTGIDKDIVDYVLEVEGSHKIGNYVPGTVIPIVKESVLFTDQPDYALLLSWHIADELIPKLRKKGFKGKFIVPLPLPKIVR